MAAIGDVGIVPIFTLMLRARGARFSRLCRLDASDRPREYIAVIVCGIATLGRVVREPR
jgi:hypothetical protein